MMVCVRKSPGSGISRDSATAIGDSKKVEKNTYSYTFHTDEDAKIKEGKLLKAKINLLDNFANVKILDKETGISPGQACVFYSKDDIGDKVLGGGWIHKTINKNLST